MAAFINVLLNQAGWFACVLGVAWEFQWLGIGMALCLLSAHCWLASDRQLQFRLILVAALVGLTVDTAQLWAGVYAFPNGMLLDELPPPFMTVLWMQFATTLRYSVSWLGKRYLLSAFFGFVGGPLAFFAGERLGAIEFLSPRLLHFLVLGAIWSGSVPFLVYASDNLTRNDDPAPGYRWPFSSKKPIFRTHSSPDP